MFYNNETLLKKQTLLEHFNKDNKKFFLERHIEFSCKKGRNSSHPQNRDNFFAVMDGDFKIFGMFDGHGIFGHVVSGFAAGCMLDFLRNQNSKIFSPKKIDEVILFAIFDKPLNLSLGL